MPERCVLYVDGFNFYYAIKKNAKATPIYLGWCDFGALARGFMLPPGSSLVGVKYFTAPVKEYGDKGGAKGGEAARQQAWLDAVRDIPDLVVVEGFYRRGDDDPDPHAKSKKRDEKQTDVNIAVALLVDAHLGAYDRALLLTGDQDQIPAVNAVTRVFGRRLDVWLPPNSPTPIPLAWQVLEREGVRTRAITAEMLGLSRLPEHSEAPSYWRAPPGPAKL
ncbi:MAG: NYN domain-containing protein [Gemmatimonadaceae bacterium]